jgi:hypothetical protein
MAFLKYRGSTTEPGVWSGTVAAAAPLTNLDIDKNFKSLDSQKLENSGYSVGALIYAQTGGTLTSLGPATNGNVLKLVDGAPSWQVDTGTKYDVKAITATGGASIRLTGSDSTTDDLKLASGTNITVAYTDDNTITISAGAATTLADDTTKSATYYPLFTTSSTNTNLTVSRVSSTKLTFNPSIGELGATNFNSLSDVRFKKDLQQISGALDKVKQLTGYTYTLVEENVRSSGLITQQVEKVMPEVIGGNDERKTLAYGNMMGLIVEAIKELDIKLEHIQSQLSNK